MRAIEIGFWASTGLVFYAYAGYAAAIWLLSRLFGRVRSARGVGDGQPPSVTLVLAAFTTRSR